MTAPGWFRVSMRSFLLLARRFSNGQVLTGSFSGPVKDESGGVLPAASVHLSSPVLVSGPIAMVTNEEGSFDSSRSQAANTHPLEDGRSRTVQRFVPGQRLRRFTTGDARRPILILAKREGNRWIAIHQSEGAVMQTKRGRPHSSTRNSSDGALCASTLGCSGRAAQRRSVLWNRQQPRR